MAGYSGTPLPAKLGIKAGVTVALLEAPRELLRDLPPDVAVRRQAKGRACAIDDTWTGSRLVWRREHRDRLPFDRAPF